MRLRSGDIRSWTVSGIQMRRTRRHRRKRPRTTIHETRSERHLDRPSGCDGVLARHEPTAGWHRPPISDRHVRGLVVILTKAVPSTDVTQDTPRIQLHLRCLGSYGLLPAGRSSLSAVHLLCHGQQGSKSSQIYAGRTRSMREITRSRRRMHTHMAMCSCTLCHGAVHRACHVLRTEDIPVR